MGNLASNSERPVALVTGAARGIGKGCALALAQAGFNILLNDMTDEEDRLLLNGLAESLSEFGADSVLFPADIADLEKHAQLADSALARWGRIDCLVNNAGVSVKKRGDLLEVTPDSFDRSMNINTKSVFFLSQVIARHMMKQGEIDGQHRSIINMTSCNATVVSISRGEYCVSKAASSMITKLFGLRLANEGIGVYEIRPGMIETEMTSPVRKQYDEMISSGFVPMRRWGKPSDIASTVVCMAEGKLPYTVAQPIVMDGGLTIVTF